ncbi:hypothetical protein L9F63_015052, partial [Diploptera punctata]
EMDGIRRSARVSRLERRRNEECEISSKRPKPHGIYSTSNENEYQNVVLRIKTAYYFALYK